MRKIIISIFILIIFNVLVGCNTEKKYDVTFKLANNINDDVIIFEPGDKEKEYTIEFSNKEINFYVVSYYLNDHPTLDGIWQELKEGDFEHSIYEELLILNEEGIWESYGGVNPYWWGTYRLSFLSNNLAKDWDYRSFSLIVHVI